MIVLPPEQADVFAGMKAAFIARTGREPDQAELVKLIVAARQFPVIEATVVPGSAISLAEEEELRCRLQ